jgi:hypothetical protein
VADARLRMLERRAAGGDVEARWLLLSERVRVGTLAPERLELAAYLGEEAAVLARPDAPRGPGLSFGHWLAGLEGWGLRLVLWALGEAAAACLPALQAQFADDAGQAEVEAWVAFVRERSGGPGARVEPPPPTAPGIRRTMIRVLNSAVEAAALHPYYLPDGDPEVQRAYRDRFPNPEEDAQGNRWRYACTQPDARGWSHTFRHERHPVAQTFWATVHSVSASPGWEPPSGAPRRCPPGRVGIMATPCLTFSDLIPVLRVDETEVRRAVREALAPWALAAVQQRA